MNALERCRCKHPQPEHWRDFGPCEHLEYANGRRCDCVQFRPVLDKSLLRGAQSAPSGDDKE